MLSRVAESIYWMSRYVERAENVARFVDVNLNLSLDVPNIHQSEQWLPLVITTGDDKLFYENYDSATRHNVIRFLTFDRQNPNSIVSCLTAARENARSVREIISSEMWEQINRFYLMVHAAPKDDTVDDPHDFFETVRMAGQSMVGVTEATMTHGEAWHFDRLGRYLERADKTSRILDVKYFILLPRVEDVGTPLDDIQWTSLLKSASAFEMYRQRHGRITPDRIVEFLILDREFPRAVLFCLTHANETLHAISGTPVGTFGNLAEQRLGQLRAELAYRRPDEIVKSGLHEFCDNLQTRLNLVGSAVNDAFFAMRPMAAGVA